MDTDSNHVRLSAIGIVAISLFVALFMRLWFLQGIDRQEFEAASVSNRLRVIHEEGPRGRILDRNGKVLVDNRTSIVVSLDREPLRKMEPDERKSVLVHLSDELTALGQPTQLSQLQKAYDDKRYLPQEYVPIADDVPQEVEIQLMERADEFPAAVVERKAIRVYPYGKTAAHLLGYVGEINDKELAERGGDPAAGGSTTTSSTTTTEAESESGDRGAAKDYRLGDSIGKGGVERAYEDDLRGVPGQRTIEVNAQGDLVDVVSLDSPKPGDDVWLTIDVDMQAHAERLLEAKIQALRGRRDKDNNRLNAPQGSVVIEDPTNGQILAMASYPDYDPATVVNGISQDLWAQLNDPASGQPLVNWAIQGTYAPGSTFKLYTAYAALRSGFLNGNDVINDPGYWDIENCEGETCRKYNAGRQPHHRVDLPSSLTVSSDVYYYRIADKLWSLQDLYGQTPIQDAAAEFGLGSRTGIPLGGENPGRLPTPESRREAYEARPDLFVTGDWRSGDNVNTAIGQGDVLATPLQVANSYSTFANGGTRYQPQVVTKVTREIDPKKGPGEAGNYEVVRRVEPVEKGTVAFSPDIYSKIFQGLVGVTQNAGGTAAASWAADPTAWPMGGKTGTAQVKDKADSALFVGWGPAVIGTEPEYTISVVIPEAGFGGQVAAPLAFRILAPISWGLVPPACPTAEQAACDAAIAQAEIDSRNDVAYGGSD